MGYIKATEAFPGQGIDAFGTIPFVAEELVPDGTNGPTFVDDVGSDGTNQFNVVRFLGAGRTYVYLNGTLPEDYYPGGSITVDLHWRTDSTMVPTSAGTVVSWAGTADYTTPVNPLETATTSYTALGTTIDKAGTAIGTKDWVNDNYSDLAIQNVLLSSRLDMVPSGESPKPLDHFAFELGRATDLAQKNANHVEVIGGFIRYQRGFDTDDS